MATLKLVGERQWEFGTATTVRHENVDGIGWSYVIRTGSPGFVTVCETLDEAMAMLKCDKVEVGAREAAELSRD